MIYFKKKFIIISQSFLFDSSLSTHLIDFQPLPKPFSSIRYYSIILKKIINNKNTIEEKRIYTISPNILPIFKTNFYMGKKVF